MEAAQEKAQETRPLPEMEDLSSNPRGVRGREAAVSVWLASSFQELATQQVFLPPAEAHAVYVFSMAAPPQ